MAQTPPTLLEEIEAFLSDTGMGESYFGKRAAGNSELVARLRNDGRVWPETEAKIRSYMLVTRGTVRNRGHGAVNQRRQATHPLTVQTGGEGAA